MNLHLRPSHLPGLALVFVLLLSLTGCQGRKDKIVILSRSLKQQNYTSTAAPQEFGSIAGLSGSAYVVVGQVQNKDTRDVHHLQISFPCKAGVERHVMTAEIPLLPAGKTIAFSTQPYESKVAVTLIEGEEPEITMDR